MNAKGNSENQDKDSEEERWKLTFDRHHDFIVDRMSPDFGLIDKLYSKSAITEGDKEEIETEKVVRKRNENLIKCLERKLKLGMLIQVLRESDQRHLVKYLESDGNYSDEFDGEWPLTEKEILTIKVNYESLIDLIDTSDLIDRLYSAGVINKIQREFISSKSTSYERNKALLEIVRRGSLCSYGLTIRCLHQSNQSHIAEILEKGDVIVPVHATLECENLDDVETQIVNQMAQQADDLMSKASAEQRHRLIDALYLKLIAFRRGKSIIIYTSCNKEEEFIHLCKIIDNSEMGNILEQLFNLLIPNVKIKVVLVTVLSEDIAKAKQIFENMKSSWISKGSISDLSLELIDTILEKSYLLSIQRQSESPQNQTDEVVIKQLASVDFCWFRRITRKRFKNVVRSKMKKYYEDKCKLYLMYKNNQQFFEEIHQISSKTRTTLSTAHLSKSGSANGKRKRSLKKRQTENQIHRTAFLGPDNEDSIYTNFLSSFDPKDHELIHEIMKTGGGAARVEIKLTRPLTKFELIAQQFEDKEMRILRSLADRDAVVWIWCHSNNALQKLNNRDGLKKLIAIVHQSVKATSDVLEHKTNIDCDHLKKKIVSIPLVFVDFRTTLNFYRKNLSETRSSYSDIYRVIDVTKLKMKIYVLCLITEDASFSTIISECAMICVFEDRSPYPIVEEILLRRNDISEFMSIVSSVKENCLYVLTSRKIKNHYVDEVLRVEIKEIEENSLQDPSKWLELEEGYHPSVLSMSRDEDLMMVSSSSPIILRIYNSDARLRLSVKLHEDILETRKAVEASNGNFIILHSMKRQTRGADDDVRTKGTNEDDALEEESSFGSLSSDNSNDVYEDAKDRLENEDDMIKQEEEEKSPFGSSSSGDSISGRSKERAFLWTVSEVSRDGKTIIRRFIPQNQQQRLDIRFSFEGGDLCTDSKGRVFVADTYNHRVIVLDSYLRWIGILISQVKKRDENDQLLWPLKLCYDEDLHEMIITKNYQVFIYDLIFPVDNYT